MKNLKNTTNVAGQSNKNIVKSQKHDVNLQKNSTLYFQVGLILCLLATYGLFEMKFETQLAKLAQVAPIDENSEYFADKFKVFEAVPQKKEVKPKAVKLADNNLKPVDNDYNDELITDILTPDDITTDKPTGVGDLKPTIETPETIEQPFSIIGVEKVPVYPGCESATTNEERLQCMSDKLTKLIQKKFNTELAHDLGLSGTQKIYVAFKIDKNGMVTDVRARAPHNQLEKEALRLTTKIPKMTPGKQRNIPVDVLYNLPIVFQVQ